MHGSRTLQAATQPGLAEGGRSGDALLTGDDAAAVDVRVKGVHSEGGGAVDDRVPRLQDAPHEQVEQLVRPAANCRQGARCGQVHNAGRKIACKPAQGLPQGTHPGCSPSGRPPSPREPSGGRAALGPGRCWGTSLSPAPGGPPEAGRTGSRSHPASRCPPASVRASCGGWAGRGRRGKTHTNEGD